MKRNLVDIVDDKLEENDDTLAFIEVVHPDADGGTDRTNGAVVEASSPVPRASTAILDRLGVSDRVVRSLVRKRAVTDRQVRDAHEAQERELSERAAILERATRG